MYNLQQKQNCHKENTEEACQESVFGNCFIHIGALCFAADRQERTQTARHK